jgi:hypothetical protein
MLFRLQIGFEDGLKHQHRRRLNPAYGAGVAKALGIKFKPQVIAAE